MLINIGLNTNDGGRISAHLALAALAMLGVRAEASTVATSDTEPTLVASLSRPITKPEGERLARALRQDCVAVFDGVNGQLYGPSAEAWGPFDPAFFLTLDGSRLNATAEAA